MNSTIEASEIKISEFAHRDRPVLNLIAVFYSLLSYGSGIALILQRNGWLNAAGVVVLTHSLIISAYLAHEFMHGTIFRSRRWNEVGGTIVLWLTGACYAKFADLAKLHIAHHVDRVDFCRFVSTKGTNLIADVIAVRQSVLDKRKPELLSLLKAADKASKLLQVSDPDALKISAAKLSLKPDELKEQLAGVKFFDLVSNKTIGFNAGNANNLFKNLELTAKVAYDLKVTPKLIEPKNTYDDSLLKLL
jgi:hypothetical protein